MPISNLIIQSELAIATASRVQFTGDVAAVLVRLNSGAGIVQNMTGNVATFPYSRVRLYPLIEIAGAVTSVGNYKISVETVRGLLDLSPLITTYGIGAIWGVDVFPDRSNLDLLMYGYVP